MLMPPRPRNHREWDAVAKTFDAIGDEAKMADAADPRHVCVGVATCEL